MSILLHIDVSEDERGEKTGFLIYFCTSLGAFTGDELIWFRSDFVKDDKDDDAINSCWHVVDCALDDETIGSFLLVGVVVLAKFTGNAVWRESTRGCWGSFEFVRDMTSFFEGDMSLSWDKLDECAAVVVIMDALDFRGSGCAF